MREEIVSYICDASSYSFFHSIITIPSLFSWSDPSFKWDFLLSKTQQRSSANWFSRMATTINHRPSVVETEIIPKPCSRTLLVNSLSLLTQKGGITVLYKRLLNNVYLNKKNITAMCVRVCIVFLHCSALAALHRHHWKIAMVNVVLLLIFELAVSVIHESSLAVSSLFCKEDKKRRRRQQLPSHLLSVSQDRE